VKPVFFKHTLSDLKFLNAVLY